MKQLQHKLLFIGCTVSFLKSRRLSRQTSFYQVSSHMREPFPHSVPERNGTGKNGKDCLPCLRELSQATFNFCFFYGTKISASEFSKSLYCHSNISMDKGFRACNKRIHFSSTRNASYLTCVLPPSTLPDLCFFFDHVPASPMLATSISAHYLPDLLWEVCGCRPW